MTDYRVKFDTEAWKVTGRGYRVSCYEDGIFVWHQYCVDQKEIDVVTGDICKCGCADYDEYTNHAGTFRKCEKCNLARMKPNKKGVEADGRI